MNSKNQHFFYLFTNKQKTSLTSIFCSKSTKFFGGTTLLSSGFTKHWCPRVSTIAVKFWKKWKLCTKTSFFVCVSGGNTNAFTHNKQVHALLWRARVVGGARESKAAQMFLRKTQKPKLLIIYYATKHFMHS